MWPLCCCCDECNHDETNNECCRCVPKEICYTFQPDDEFADPTVHVFGHSVDGHYSPIQIRVSPTQIWIGLELEKNVSGDCVWRVWTADNSDGTSPSQEHETLTSGTNVGCLTESTDEINISPWTHIGATGDLRLHPRLHVLIPKVDGVPICTDCDCFEECLCLKYTVQYPGGDESSDNVQAARVCWNPDVGSFGGWEFAFPGSDCMPSQTVTLELKDDGTGSCEMVLTDEDNFTQSSTTSGTTACATGFSGLAWYYAPSDPAINEIRYAIEDGACEHGCETPCCQYLPDELNALIELDDGDPGFILNGPLNLTLTRDDCNEEVYSGSATNFIEWDCEDDLGAPSAGYGDVSIEIRCRGGGANGAKDCQYNHVEDECACDCDPTEEAGIGCWLMTGASFTDFECYDPADCSEGSAGHRTNQTSKCGTRGGDSYVSECDPVYLTFFVPVSGFASCLDGWKITVTE